MKMVLVGATRKLAQELWLKYYLGKPCGNCGSGVRRNDRYGKLICRMRCDENQREYRRRYYQSDKGRETLSRYNRSPERQAADRHRRRVRLGWYEPGEMATDEEVWRFFNGFKL